MIEDTYITKRYFEKKLDERFSAFEIRLDKKLDEKLDTKFKSWDVQIRQYMRDLTSGFNEKNKGVGEYVLSIEERVQKLEDLTSK